jgi:hypothetical protein
MTPDDFAEALRRLVGDAEDAGLDHETLATALEDATGAIRTHDH